MMPEDLLQKIEELEIHEKPNLDETELVNLGDEDAARETRISIHLKVKKKHELIELLR